jgi:poly [ADP-ribose] polymerase
MANPDVHLVMVTTINNNKFYDMKDNDDGTFTATWGRIGATSDNQTYPIKQWNSKFKEKVKKGYVDQSHLFIKTAKAGSLLTISDKDVNALVVLLQKFANKSVSDNYTVDASAVTKAQIDAAQAVMNDLTSFVSKRSLDSDDVNEQLVKLYSIIPRRMANVKYHLIEADKPAEMKSALQTIISAEQDTLDVMAGQVSTLVQTQDTIDDKKNILDVLGLTCTILPDDAPAYKQIKKMMGSASDRLEAMYEVKLAKTENPFSKNLTNAKDKTTQLFWHGSRNENWWSILQTGLLVRPTNAVISGKMFGYGIYGADKFEKSYGYTSARGSYWARGDQGTAFLGVFDFHMGNTLTVKRWESWHGSLTYKKLREQGNYDSLTALGGADLRNNEYIVYQENQITVRYLVKVKG